MGKKRYADAGIVKRYAMAINQYCVPNIYISAGVPSKVIADMKLASRDKVTGKTPMERLAIRNSFVDFCLVPQNA